MICLADFGSGEPFTGKSFPGTVWRVNSLAMPLALHATSKNPVTWSYENTHAVVNLYAKNMLVGFWMLELTAAPKNLTEFNAKLEEFSWPLSLYIALGFLDSADFNDEAKRNKSSSPLSTESEGLDLTLRQLSILRGISQMKTNHQIAIEYGLSVSTVRHETKEIFDILGVVGRIEAANEARKLGIT